MRGAGIRLMEERRDAESGEMTDEQFAFVRAVDDWKLRNRRPYPTLTEILAVAKTLGYRLGGGELRAAPPIERDEPTVAPLICGGQRGPVLVGHLRSESARTARRLAREVGESMRRSR